MNNFGREGNWNLLLKGNDGGNAVVDGIQEAGLRLVADGEDGIEAAGQGSAEQ